MKITFKEQPCKLICRIYVEDVFAGEVHKDIFSSKWTIKPDFEANTNYYSELRYEYFSSYEAGKEMVGIYNFLYPQEEEQDLQEYGISLDDMLVFLKERI